MSRPSRMNTPVIHKVEYALVRRSPTSHIVRVQTARPAPRDRPPLRSEVLGACIVAVPRAVEELIEGAGLYKIRVHPEYHLMGAAVWVDLGGVPSDCAPEEPPEGGIEVFF